MLGIFVVGVNRLRIIAKEKARYISIGLCKKFY